MTFHMKLRIIKDRLFTLLLWIFSLSICIPLIFILFYLIKNGISSITPSFFYKLPVAPGEIGGGIVNAITGSIFLVSMALIFSLPIGIFSGVFLSEFRDKKITAYFQSLLEIMQSIPSIVIGIIAYAWLVVSIGHFSAISGAVALALMMLPMLIKSTEETLKMIPNELKEAAIALGVPYYKVMLKVILPSASSGIINGIILSIARISGETAPLLFTAFGNPFVNWNPLKPVHSLPLLIFNYATSPYEEWHKIAWGASLILIVFVLILNLIARRFARK
jgi:phosphate transport system permease protein